jgi:predicted secreted hydrolase
MRSVRLFTMVLALLAAGCGTMHESAPGAPVSSTPTPTVRPASLFLTPPPRTQPVSFPRDAGPHDVLTEWWYYTGHLATADGRRFGFEFVVFQGQRFGYPPAYAAHFAVTDLERQAFHWAERTAVSPRPEPVLPVTLHVGDWLLQLGRQADRIQASMPGYALELVVRDRKPPVLHDEDGYFTWAPETGSYYYSRTRLEATGTLTVEGQPLRVSGQAWMDHQWGNFLLTGRGGWNWFALQLDDGRELMLWNTHDGAGQVVFGSGTLVQPDGTPRYLAGAEFTVTATGQWTSPHSGATYPSGWIVELPAERLTLTVRPLLLDQELQALASTGVVYWEGAVEIHGRQGDQSVTGVGYVELTGYAPDHLAGP